MEVTCTGPRTVGDWILTGSGVKFWPLSPAVEDVRLGDIAHALASICRWTGHTQYPLSVARHALLVSQVVERLAPDLALAALHHDSAEAYIGDIATPLKRFLGVDVGGEIRTIERVEQTLLQVIFQALQIPWPDLDGWAVIESADRRVLLAEARDLMPPMPAEAALHAWGQPAPGLQWTDFGQSVGMDTRMAFLAAHARLGGTTGATP
jgi:hypothetical protein